MQDGTNRDGVVLVLRWMRESSITENASTRSVVVMLAAVRKRRAHTSLSGFIVCVDRLERQRLVLCSSKEFIGGTVLYLGHKEMQHKTTPCLVVMVNQFRKQNNDVTATEREATCGVVWIVFQSSKIGMPTTPSTDRKKTVLLIPTTGKPLDPRKPHALHYRRRKYLLVLWFVVAAGWNDGFSMFCFDSDDESSNPVHDNYASRTMSLFP